MLPNLVLGFNHCLLATLFNRIFYCLIIFTDYSISKVNLFSDEHILGLLLVSNDAYFFNLPNFLLQEGYM